MTSAAEWIEHLQLVRHPEGGYFRESYRAQEIIPRPALPPRFTGDRVFCTAIYFLLEGNEVSALHRIKADEVWHFYAGVPLTVHVIDLAGRYAPLHLGMDLEEGQLPQAVVPAGCLFGASVADGAGFTLAGCTVAPGFDFADFELPGRAQLLAEYPQHKEVILRLTR
jgi:predicted cupin superfamily sugar epimerase